MRRGRRNFDEDPATFPRDARYTVAGWPGIAVYVHGWETEPDEDTEWTGTEERTGKALVTMVGDDAQHAVDVDDLQTLGELDYCAACGQVGCGHDGRDRSEEGAE